MTGIVVLALILLPAGWYVTTGYIWRYKKCRHCRGLGDEPLGAGAVAGSRSGRRQCRECRGYGRVPRLAARHVDSRHRSRRRPRRRAVRR